MTDLLYVVVTLAAFVGLALLVGALDRAEQGSNQGPNQSSNQGPNQDSVR